LPSLLKKLNLSKASAMALQTGDLEDQSKFRLIAEVSYDDLIPFILDYLKRKSWMMTIFWSACLLFLLSAISIRIEIAGYFSLREIMTHTILGLIVMPLASIPVHELLHIIPYYLSGARDIKVGMDIRQFLFYVTAHRYVAGPLQFRIVAVMPFLLITGSLISAVFLLPGLWKWSFSLFLFVHTTMCAGDFALLNFYNMRKGRKIYTWDDADLKIAYFYEEI
jgi:hypothetical protein